MAHDDGGVAPVSPEKLIPTVPKEQAAAFYAAISLSGTLRGSWRGEDVEISLNVLEGDVPGVASITLSRQLYEKELNGYVLGNVPAANLTRKRVSKKWKRLVQTLRSAGGFVYFPDGHGHVNEKGQLVFLTMLDLQGCITAWRLLKPT